MNFITVNGGTNIFFLDEWMDGSSLSQLKFSKHFKNSPTQLYLPSAAWKTKVKVIKTAKEESESRHLVLHREDHLAISIPAHRSGSIRFL